MISCTRRIEWDAMHRIPRHESVCKAYHGHRYSADVTCTAPLDELGRVVDFGVIRDRVGGWIQERWDHTAILMEGDPDPSAKVVAEANARNGKPVYWMPAPPTAENLAAELGRVAAELLADTGVTISRVRVWETPNCYADWTAA
jgi:6-pyruvoyltetrahydropterin/6-carboxytetrahydropterin synthase